MVVRLLERLNTPWVVLVVLVLFIIVDGFLLYRYQQSLESANRPNSEGIVVTVEETTVSPGQEPTTVEETTVSLGQRTSADGKTASSPALEEPRVLRVGVTVVGNPSWLSVQQDGSVVLERVGQPGFSQEFEAVRELSIQAGNAGAVEVEVNGQDLGVLGESGEVMSRTFTL